MHNVHGPQGHENQKIAPFIVPYTRGRGLDLGCGVKKTFPHFLSVDIESQNGFPIADVQDDCMALEWVKEGSQDFVFSSHLLEHLRNAEGALALWWRLLRPSGHLVLYLPHDELYPLVGHEHGNPDHKHDLNPAKIMGWMETIAHDSGHGWTLLENEVRDQGDGLEPLSEYSFFQVYQKHDRPQEHHHSVRCLEQPWRRPDKKSCLVVRYGAFGDHIMAASALAALKEEGWHVTYNCEQRGFDIMRDDPNIDAFWLQDTDQVPNHLLGEYWRRLHERYDAVFNLSESIEVNLLGVKGRLQHSYEAEVRRRVMGTVNYLDRTHDLCAVPREPKRPGFFPDSRELNWAHKQIGKARRLYRGHRLNEQAPVILWSLAGSSKHKTYPHMDSVIGWLINETDAIVVLVGDQLGKVLEVGWEDEKRVWCRAGEWTIRQSLTFAQLADVVVGPETGILNAVSMLPQVGKVIYLSHSSHENLTRDWPNTSVLHADPKEVSCSPCHLMHYGGWEFCRRSPVTGVAACATSIPPEVVYGVIKDTLQQRAAAA